MTRMLIVDDEPEILEGTRWAFEVAGFEVYTAASGEEALPRTRSLKPDVLLIDYKLPGLTGLDVLREAKREDPKAVAIMITGLTHEVDDVEAASREFGAAGFLHKPLQIQTVLEIVREKIRPSTSSGRTGRN